MRRWRYLRTPLNWRRKHIITLTIVLGMLFLLVTQSGLYDFTMARLNIRGEAKTEKDVMLKKRIVSSDSGEYQLENPYKLDFSRGQSKIIDNLLGGKESGFFLDIGAGNGETNSVSLYFERTRKWRGVMVEANEAKHRWSIIKNRQSQMWNVRLRFDKEVISDAVNDITPDQLFTMINRTFIHLLIVNLKELELDLVRHIDFTKYHFRVITIELQNEVSEDKYIGISNILATHGYRPEHFMVNSFQGKRDVIFMMLQS